MRSLKKLFPLFAAAGVITAAHAFSAPVFAASSARSNPSGFDRQFGLCSDVASRKVISSDRPAVYDRNFESGCRDYLRGQHRDAYETWYELAARGDSRSALAIGVLAEHGLGVVRDQDAARMWYRYALDLGNKDAVRRLRDIGVVVTQSDAVSADVAEKLSRAEQKREARRRQKSVEPQLKRRKIAKWSLIGAGIAGAGAGIYVAVDGDDSSASETTGGSDNPADDDLTPPPTGAPSEFETSEYDAQGSLARINASSAYARGTIGQAIDIAVLSTGIDSDHPEFDTQIAPGGFDFVASSETVSDVSDGTNFAWGTFLSGVIAANQDGEPENPASDPGMHGVAYGADVIPYRVGDDVLSEDFDLRFADDAVISAISAGAEVINASISIFPSRNEQTIGANVITTDDENFASELINAANVGIVTVAAAGDQGVASPSLSQNPVGPGLYPYVQPANNDTGIYVALTGNNNVTTTNANFSALDGNLLAVVSVASNNNIAASSNRCGVAQNWCLAAPGTQILGPANGGGYVEASGTSAAAAHVTGALAVVMQRFPELTAQEAAQILLDTATDLGETGVDNVYGHGLLNLDAATSPQGSVSVALTGSAFGLQTSLSNTTLTPSVAFGNSLNQALNGLDIGVMDEYLRNFTVSASGLLRPQSDIAGLSSSRHILSGFGVSHTPVSVALADGVTARISDIAVEGLRPGQARDVKTTQLSVDQKTENGSQLTLMAGSGLNQTAFGLNVASHDASRSLHRAGRQAHPYLGLVDEGVSTHYQLTLSQSSGLRFAMAHGEAETGGSNFVQAVMLTQDFGLQAQHKWGVSMGVLYENETVLGLKGEGALRLNGAMTGFISAEMAYSPSKLASVYGQFFAGATMMRDTSASLLQSGEDMMLSSAFRLGAAQEQLFHKNDRFDLTVYQPLRLESGDITLTLPQYRDREGVVYSDNHQIDLAPGGREIAFEASYRFMPSNDLMFTTGAAYRHQPDHDALADPDLRFLLRLNRAF